MDGRWVWTVVLLVAACGDRGSDTDDATSAGRSANAGSGPGLSVSGRGGTGGASSARAGKGGTPSNPGNAGNSGGSGAAETCAARERRATEAVAAALAGVDLSCRDDADCKLISIDTDCHAACGALVGRGGEAPVQAAIDAQNAGVCAGFEDDGCQRLIPPCAPPQPVACVSRTCQYVEPGQPLPDAGAPDSSTPQDGCFDGALNWGLDGGFVAYRDRFQLESCRSFSAARTGAALDPVGPRACMNEIAATAAITAEDVNTALAHPDVIAAIAAAPVLYGRDSRPVDGVVFRIERAGAVIELGDACAGGAGCRAIPTGLQALRELLQDLQQQQLALPNCESLQP